MVNITMSFLFAYRMCWLKHNFKYVIKLPIDYLYDGLAVVSEEKVVFVESSIDSLVNRIVQFDVAQNTSHVLWEGESRVDAWSLRSNALNVNSNEMKVDFTVYDEESQTYDDYQWHKDQVTKQDRFERESPDGKWIAIKGR